MLLSSLSLKFKTTLHLTSNIKGIGGTTPPHLWFCLRGFTQPQLMWDPKVFTVEKNPRIRVNAIRKISDTFLFFGRN